MDTFLQLDGQILLWIQEVVRTDVLNPLVTGITHLGDGGILWIGLLLLCFCIPKTRKAALLAASALLLTFLVTNVWLKPFVARVRPYEALDGLHRLIEKQSDYSFPSGHTANSMAVGVSLWLVSRASKKETACSLYFPKPAGWFFLILAVLISLSRLYVGVHYPTDVLCGALVAIAAAALVFFGYQRMQAKQRLY